MSTERSFEELRSSGLLWLLNREVFHPRGYALALNFEFDDDGVLGVCTGWTLLGDGSEPWSMGAGAEEVALFLKVKELLK